jgi:hypothetical protein
VCRPSSGHDHGRSRSGRGPARRLPPIPAPAILVPRVDRKSAGHSVGPARPWSRRIQVLPEFRSRFSAASRQSSPRAASLMRPDPSPLSADGPAPLSGLLNLRKPGRRGPLSQQELPGAKRALAGRLMSLLKNLADPSVMAPGAALSPVASNVAARLLCGPIGGGRGFSADSCMGISGMPHPAMPMRGPGSLLAEGFDSPQRPVPQDFPGEYLAPLDGTCGSAEILVCTRRRLPRATAVPELAWIQAPGSIPMSRPSISS